MATTIQLQTNSMAALADIKNAAYYQTPPLVALPPPGPNLLKEALQSWERFKKLHLAEIESYNARHT